MKHEAAEIFSYYGGEIEENYSGKGMYGKTTTAIIFDSTEEFFKAIADIMTDTLQDVDYVTADSVAYALKHLKEDSMGKDAIIYY